MHVYRCVELVALDTLLAALAPDQLTRLGPDPVAGDLGTVDRLDGVAGDPFVVDGPRHNTLTLPRLPAECLASI